jgi:tripeptide aminopeptidase
MNLKKVLSITAGENVYFITEYILGFLRSNKMNFVMDGEGNIYITKGQSDIYPCVTAHLDTVHKFGDINIIEKDGKYSSKIGIGGDDKVGVYCCLALLKALDVIKVAFFNGEERGCTGSKNPWKKFFKDVGYLIAIDRRGNSDYINSYGMDDTTSKEFDKAIEGILAKNGYKSASGLITDAFKLQSEEVVEVSTCNFSCGYYNPHTTNEYVVETDVHKALKMIYKIILRLGNKKYPHKITKKTYVCTSGYTYKAQCDWCRVECDLSKLTWNHGSRLCPDCAETANYYTDKYITGNQKLLPKKESKCDCCGVKFAEGDLITKVGLFKNDPKRSIKICTDCNVAYKADDAVLNNLIY